jgi:DNA-binding HxlR family transcriptional regulator
MATVLKPEVSSPIQRTLEDLDEVIHQKARLSVMSTLVSAGETDFSTLKAQLGLTDGNLSIHLTKLEDAGYISVHKELVHKKPRTTYMPTDKGREAFRKYVAALEQIVHIAGVFAVKSEC